MADKTKIEWTEATWNILTGCTMVDAGCTNCYAMGLAASRLKNHPSREGLTRESGGRHVWTGETRFNEQWLDQPLKWKRGRMIFVCAHGDLFHESVPDEWIDKVFAVMALAPQHTFQVLTKRPDRAARYLAGLGDPGHANFITRGHGRLLRAANEAARNTPALRYDMPQRWPLPNVWLGTSISDQASWDARWPWLEQCPAARLFVSAEPLLGPVNMRGTGNLDWLICGGESGKNARPMHPDWARSLRDQCQAAGVAFFFKQWGEWLPFSQFADDGDWLYEPLDDPESDASRRCNYASCCLDSDGKRYSTGEPNRLHRMEAGAFSGPSPMQMFRIGKARAGRLLDGVEWSQMPGVQR